MTSVHSSTSTDNPRMISIGDEETKHTFKSLLENLLELLGSINTSIQNTLEKHERETVARAFCIASQLFDFYTFVTKETVASVNGQDERNLKTFLPRKYEDETLSLDDQKIDTKSEPKKTANAPTRSPRQDLPTKSTANKTTMTIKYDSSSRSKRIFDFVQTIDTNIDTKKMTAQEISPIADLEADPFILRKTILEYEPGTSSRPVVNAVQTVDKRSDNKKFSAPKKTLRLDLETNHSMPRKKIIHYEHSSRSKAVLKSIQLKDIGKKAKSKKYANNGASSRYCAEENSFQSLRHLGINRYELLRCESQQSAPDLTDDHSSNHKLSRRLSLNQTGLPNVRSSGLSHQLLFDISLTNKHPSGPRKISARLLPNDRSSKLDKDTVRRNFIYLKTEIDARKLADYMYQGNAFSFDERTMVSQAKTKALANELLFNFLMDNETEIAFGEFKKSLEKVYPHVAKVLADDILKCIHSKDLKRR